MGSLPQRRGRTALPSRDADDALDLFSRRRNSIPIATALNESVRLDRLSFGSGKGGRGGMDDLMDADVGKNDYDWLLTPPGTPLFPSADARENIVQPPVQKKTTSVRSVSNTRASRLSTPQSENNNTARPARSNSVTRNAVSSTYSSYFTNNNRTSMLNTSSASVTSRPTTPGNRPSSSQSSTRPTTPGNRPSSSQSSTRPTLSSNRPSSSQSSTRPSMSTTSTRSRLPSPAKARPSPIPPVEKPRPLTNGRPSTPTPRPQTPNSSNTVRSISRPSTPTQRAPAPPIARSPSVGRTPPSNGRNPGPASRPSSPGPRPRAPVRPTDLPDFPTDVPPNLRTKLPDRPPSAGRARPGGLTSRSNSNTEAAVPASLNRRQSLPNISRSKVTENPPKSRLYSNTNSNAGNQTGMQKLSVSEPGNRRPSKPATAGESTGFGRTISKKSIDMALRHMDIRQSMGGVRGASLFPQSIRSASSKGRPARMSDPVVPVAGDEAISETGSRNGLSSVNGDCNAAFLVNGENTTASSPEREWLVTRGGEVDIYGSTRYESMLLKEDSKNMNWLHSVEDKSDESSLFDHRFEPLPEPFGLP